MRILVAGGAGFIGSHLTHAIIKRYPELREVVVLDDLSSGAARNLNNAHQQALDQNVSFHVVTDNVENPRALSPALAKDGFDMVVHAASPASPVDHMRSAWKTISANIVGARALLPHVNKNGGRLMFLSTSEVYGDPDCEYQSESYVGRVNPVGPRAPYDEGKRVTEAFLSNLDERWSHVDVRIARLFNTFGPGMRPNDGRVVSNFIVASLRGEPHVIHGDGSQRRSLCHVYDTVRALVSLLDLKSRFVMPVNIGNIDERSILEISDFVATLMHNQYGCRLAEKVFVDSLQDDPLRRRPDLRRAAMLLDYTPSVDWTTGIHATAEWFFRNREALEI